MNWLSKSYCEAYVVSTIVVRFDGGTLAGKRRQAGGLSANVYGGNFMCNVSRLALVFSLIIATVAGANAQTAVPGAKNSNGTAKASAAPNAAATDEFMAIGRK